MTSSDDLLGQEPVDDSVEFALSASAVEAALFGTTSSVNIGRFVILGELGRHELRAGLGLAPQLDRRVALKVVRPELSGSRQDERIRREAKAAARLSDPHIVAVHEVGESDGRTFIAMEYVEGVGLDAAPHADRRGGRRTALRRGLRSSRSRPGSCTRRRHRAP